MTLSSRDMSGIGREELVLHIMRLQADVASITDEREKARREVRALTENLTHVQERCTQLLNTDRLARFLEGKPETMAALLDLAWAIDRARTIHPKGSHVTGLLAEAGEVANAIMREGTSRVRSELIDVAVICIRLCLGERDTEPTW